MKYYEGKALDEKIHSFLARKLQNYPELAAIEKESTQRTSPTRARRDVMHVFIPARLNLQF